MLNKLLKRCMPWMDKGRWYHVRTNTIGEVPVAVFDPVFMSASFDGVNVILKIPRGPRYQVIDVKATFDRFESSLPGLDDLIDVTNIVDPGMQEPSTIKLFGFDGAITDYWIFMAPLKG